MKLTTDYRDVFFFEWPYNNISYDSIENFTDGKKPRKDEGIIFVPCDLAAVPMVHEFINEKGKSHDLLEEHIYELALIADELVSNGIAATFQAQKSFSENIVLRYRFQKDSAIIQVIDYGGGMCLEEVQDKAPKGDNLAEFMENLKTYRSDNNFHVPYRGKLIKLNRFGQGLRIVFGISEAVSIYLHNTDGKLTMNKSIETLGTIISAKYNLTQNQTAP